MTDPSAPIEPTTPLPSDPETQKILDDYAIYYRTRLPVLRERTAQLEARRRRNLETLFRALGVRPPFG